MRFTPYIITAIALHIAFWKLIPEAKPHINKIENKKKYIVVKVKDKKRTIIEAPQKETLPPEEANHLGKTTHRTDKETKVKANMSANKNASNQDKSKPTKYGGLLPDSGDEYFRDFIADENVKYGPIIDVNTYEYPLLGYFSLIRQQVALSFADPRSKLRNNPRVSQRLSKKGNINYKGSSVAVFTIDRSGLLIKIETIKTSGDKELDEVWRKILILAAPFPPLPKHYNKPYLRLSYELYYDFVLDNGNEIRRFHY